jgi:Kef-type K+ transport system membrane component KefB
VRVTRAIVRTRMEKTMASALEGTIHGSSWVTTPDFSLTRALARVFAKWREYQLEFSQIDLILLMFQIGGDLEFGRLAQKRNRSAAMSIAVASIAVPLLLGDLMMVLMAIASTFMTVPLIRVIYRCGGQLIPRGIEA